MGCLDRPTCTAYSNSEPDPSQEGIKLPHTMTKTEIKYPKNERAKVSIDLT